MTDYDSLWNPHSLALWNSCDHAAGEWEHYLHCWGRSQLGIITSV